MDNLECEYVKANIWIQYETALSFPYDDTDIRP